MVFWNFSKSIRFELPRGGGRTHGRTHGGIMSFELSPLKRCMRINSNKGRPGMTETDREWNQCEKCMVLVGRYWYLMNLHMILAGRYWNSRFQPIILCGVLSIWRKKYQFYAVFWGRRELSTGKYIGDSLKFQTVWCKSISFELPRGGGRTHGRTDGRTEE